jgi:hypothetical protein
MRIDILTLFPAMFQGPFDESIVRRAIDAGIVSIHLHNLRDWTHDRHRTVDDAPFGGGPGMIMKPAPIFEAVEELATPGAEIVLLTPNGELLRQSLVQDLASQSHLVLICGHYEGVDERVAEHLATRQVSIGDYVLTVSCQRWCSPMPWCGCCPARWGAPTRPERKPTRTDYSSTHNTPGPPSIEDTTCPRSSAPATTRPWLAGSGRRPSGAPTSGAPTFSAPST